MSNSEDITPAVETRRLPSPDRHSAPTPLDVRQAKFSTEMRGYERALREARIELAPELVRGGDFRETAGLTMTRELLDLPDPPSAIFAVNNLTTIGVLGALRERRIEVPADMSVVGFDDLPTAELLHPPLTVVEQPTYRVGARAADLLIRRLREPDAAVKEVVLAARLIVRGSTAPLRAPR